MELRCIRSTRGLALVASALLCWACGCEEEAPPPPVEPPPATPEAPEPDPTPEPPPEPPPLPEAREVRLETGDGVVLVGDLRTGESPSAPLVVLVHQLSSDRAEWETLARHLAVEPAYATFAFDVRGHGDSATDADGDEVAWRDFETADWEKVSDDVRALLGHLREEEGLQPRRVALVGSSIGSSAVIRAAATDPTVDAVVALSPGRAYRGLDALTPLTELGERPLLAVASRGDRSSAETVSDMARIAPRGEASIVDGERHGVAMFEAAPESLERVIAFLRAHLSPG